jgi:hypothetical protein
MELNKERFDEQNRRNDALDKKAAEAKAEEYEIVTTRDPNEPNKPSEKGGYKRRSIKRRRRSTKRRRRSTKKRRRTMRR